MIRSMMLVCALGALGAVGCVATGDAADESAVAQNTGSSGALFDCKNVASISVIQCVGSLLNINLLNIDIKNVNVLSNDEIKVLNDDLNNLKIEDINILNVNNVLNNLELTVLKDVDVSKNDVDVCALVGVLQFCK